MGIRMNLEYHLLGRKIQSYDIAIGIAIITAISWAFFFLLHSFSNTQNQTAKRPSTPDLEKDRLKTPARKFGGVIVFYTS